MALTLSSTELEKIARVGRLLISPLDHPTVDDWRAAVNRRLKDLLSADSAGFLLPVSEGLMLFSEEHDPAELARYPDYPPPPLVDGTPLWETLVNERVITLANGYGRNYDRYLNSVYYQEYAGANGAHDTLAAAVSLGGTDARNMACLHLWHARPDGRLFGEREIMMLRLLFPAFQAGVETVIQWASHRSDLLGALDHLAQAVVVFDIAGRPIHQTPALTAMLEADPEAAQLRGRALALMNDLRKMLRVPGGAAVPGPQSVIDVRTALARYVLRAVIYGHRSTGAVPVILVAFERRTPVPLSDAEIQQQFGLTLAEARVARLIALGRSNATIARELSISPHTARHHTERVLLKMPARSRAEVAPKMCR